MISILIVDGPHRGEKLNTFEQKDVQYGILMHYQKPWSARDFFSRDPLSLDQIQAETIHYIWTGNMDGDTYLFWPSNEKYREDWGDDE